MRVSRSDGVAVGAGADAAEIRLTGDMDMATADAMLAPAYQLVADGHRHLILNCGSLDFCDSQGLMAMIRLLKAVQPDGSVTIVEPPETLVQVFTATGLVDKFTISLPK
jgi:anti-sigma B factor antagonist